MKNIPAPVGNHFDEFKKLVARKDDGPDKKVLEKNCPKIETRFAKSLEIAADPVRLVAKMGSLSILHTLGQTLQHHPHTNCVVPVCRLRRCSVRNASQLGNGR